MSRMHGLKADPSGSLKIVFDLDLSGDMPNALPMIRAKGLAGLTIFQISLLEACWAEILKSASWKVCSLFDVSFLKLDASIFSSVLLIIERCFAVAYWYIWFPSPPIRFIMIIFLPIDISINERQATHSIMQCTLPFRPQFVISTAGRNLVLH